MDASKLDDLRAKHGDVAVLSAEGYEVAVKRPGRAEYGKWRKRSGDPATRPEATEVLFRDCCVDPEPAAVGAMLDKRPALGDVFGAECLKLAGLSAEADAKN